MASSNDFYTSSPVVALPPHSSNHYFMGSHYAAPDVSNFASNATTPNGLANSQPFNANGSIPPTPGSLAGRKRSRGDIHGPDEDDDASIANFMAQGSADEMVTESSGEHSVQVAHVKRPSFSSRKSQRTDSAATGADSNLAQLVLPPHMREVTEEPLIDETTRVLGISWVRMDSTECLRISQAAYTKWIQNHYPSLKNVSVWFENVAIPGYLVEAHSAYQGQRGYYIFSNDLTEARMVTTEPGQLVPRLQMLPALHLAAPGGCLKAETDPITAAQNEVDGVQVAMSTGADDAGKSRGHGQDRASSRGESIEPTDTAGLCSAHAMELD